MLKFPEAQQPARWIAVVASLVLSEAWKMRKDAAAVAYPNQFLGKQKVGSSKIKLWMFFWAKISGVKGWEAGGEGEKRLSLE